MPIGQFTGRNSLNDSPYHEGPVRIWEPRLIYCPSAASHWSVVVIGVQQLASQWSLLPVVHVQKTNQADRMHFRRVVIHALLGFPRNGGHAGRGWCIPALFRVGHSRCARPVYWHAVTFEQVRHSHFWRTDGKHWWTQDVAGRRWGRRTAAELFQELAFLF